MSQVNLSEKAKYDLLRLKEFLTEHSWVASEKVVVEFAKVFDLLERFPVIGPALDDRYRTMPVRFGNRGYVILYYYEMDTDTVHVMRIRHQREHGFEH